MINKDNEFLDREEQQIQEDLENGLYEKAENLDKKKYSDIAKNYIEQNNNKLISIRVNKETIDRIKEISSNNGINYQTLINVILFQIANGKIELRIS